MMGEGVRLLISEISNYLRGVLTMIHMKNVFLCNEEKVILNDMTWHVEKGQHWAVYGLNGAGKTALLNMLNAAYFPSSGDLEVCGRVFGQHILADQLRRKVAVVSAGIQHKLHEEDNSFEIVLSGAFASIGLYDRVTDDMRNRAKEIMRELGNLEYANRPYAELSQGEKQRAMLGRALMSEPDLLVLDEPATSLDFIAREQLLETIEKIAGKENGPTIIYVTHHIEEILPVFSHTLLLKEGSSFAQGATQEILTSEQMSAFFEQEVSVHWVNDRPTLAKEKYIFSDNSLTR